MDEQQVQETLVGWAVRALGRWAGGGVEELPKGLPQVGEWLRGYGQVLAMNWSPEGKGKELRSVFSLIPRGEGPPESGQQDVVFPRHLSLDTILPGKSESPKDLWSGFITPYKSLGRGEHWFESFAHLFRTYAWAVPCTYGELGVSLYEEFKALTALAFASRCADKPSEGFLLIGGDIPGIQEFLYTLTSKGAAKGLRGRSFFLQLLADALVRSLVDELGLCWANVIYAAGGNFLLLAPGDPAAEARLKEWKRRTNTALLQEFDGDLGLALDWEELPGDHVRTSAFAEARGRLGAKIAVAKSQRFRVVAQEPDGWEALFAPTEQGGLKEYCAVCHHEPLKGEALIPRPTPEGETVRKCRRCRGFEGLARAIAHDRLWMIVKKTGPRGSVTSPQMAWPDVLARLTGWRYRFARDPSRVGNEGVVYTINDSDLAGAKAHGFRFLANNTPRVGNDIKDFAQLAADSQGIPRIGILRMDVDNLGSLFGSVFQGTMAQLSALSAAMELFFCGHLHHLCRTLEQEQYRENQLYVIYSGGDDLFIVGPWDLMPVLAESIREHFREHTGRHPRFTISGGATLEGEHFPLYRAAERSEEAEKRAKDYKPPKPKRSTAGAEGEAQPERPEPARKHDKDAFCFLGTAVGWEEWHLVTGQKDNLLWLIGEDAENRAKPDAERESRLPRALLQAVESVHELYWGELREAERKARAKGQPLPDARMFFGRWVWMHVYSLGRMVQRNYNSKVAERVSQLQQTILKLETVCYSGLAARWAEYLTRKEE